MRVVDLSGYSFTGKSAVYDLLMEFDGVASFGKEFEFDLIRMPGGILDLHAALTQNWSPVRSSEAIRRFRRVIRNLGGDRSMLSRLTRLGGHYDSHFPAFTECSNEYLESLSSGSWTSTWPFAYYDSGPASVIFLKSLRRFLDKDIFKAKVYLARMDDAEFLKKTRLYLYKMFSENEQLQCEYVLLNNAFEPFFPERSMRYFEDSRAIVVDRDPRDVYLSALRNGQAGGALVVPPYSATA